MKRINHIYTLIALHALLPLIVLTSCGNEDDTQLLVVGDQIPFVAGLPGVSSRSIYDVNSEILSGGITISAFRTEGADGFLSPHFQGELVTLKSDGAFRSDRCKWPIIQGENTNNQGEKITGELKFFAFHPSRSVMEARAGVGDECFVFSNATVKADGKINYDYRLTKFRVIPDISEQVDFVTAISTGNKIDHLYSGVKLAFEHQLCAVQVGVWGGATLYDIEIAGVRIGGTYVEADFCLSTGVDNQSRADNTVGSWIFTPESLHGYVDYVFNTGDKVVGINANEHNTKESFASIMGNGGNAMVIPAKHDKWDYINDSKNSGNGMYFSVLMRMRVREGDRHIVYPSVDPQSQPYLVFLVVRKSDGMVMKRLSASEYNNYTAPDGQEKRAYGWAAVPVNVDWKPGYVYSYVLDYSKAVGLHDPIDSNPATPIIGYDGVEIGIINTSQWAGGEVIKYGGWGANTNNTAPDGTVWWK